MSTSTALTTTSTDDENWNDALRAAAAFLAGFRSADTRKGYRRDLSCWLEFCAAHELHPYVAVRRTHVEVYLRQLEQQVPALANATLRRRISTLLSWFTWPEDKRSTSVTPLLVCVGRGGIAVRSRGWTATNSPTCSRPPNARAATRTRWCACSG